TSRRFVSAQGNQVNITGNCRVTTVRENILCGGLDVAAGQTFTGSKIANGDDNSFICTQRGIMAPLQLRLSI
ncbi:hypothetical protein WP50_01105, partial [Lactiplantibacillus plantarum]